MALSCLCTRGSQADGGSSFGGKGTGTPFPPGQLGFPPVSWAPCVLGRSGSSTRLGWGRRVSPSPHYSVHPPGVLTLHSGRASRSWGPEAEPGSMPEAAPGNGPGLLGHGELVPPLATLSRSLGIWSPTFSFLNRWALAFTLPLLTWFPSCSKLIYSETVQGQRHRYG